MLPQCDMATPVVTDFQYGAKLFDLLVLNFKSVTKVWHGYTSGNRFSIWSKVVWSNSVYNLKLLPQCDMATSVVTDFQYGAKLFDLIVFIM